MTVTGDRPRHGISSPAGLPDESDDEGRGSSAGSTPTEGRRPRAKYGRATEEEEESSPVPRASGKKRKRKSAEEKGEEEESTPVPRASGKKRKKGRRLVVGDEEE